jgi:hypothetical protein
MIGTHRFLGKAWSLASGKVISSIISVQSRGMVNLSLVARSPFGRMTSGWPYKGNNSKELKIY